MSRRLCSKSPGMVQLLHTAVVDYILLGGWTAEKGNRASEAGTRQHNKRRDIGMASNTQ